MSFEATNCVRVMPLTNVLVALTVLAASSSSLSVRAAAASAEQQRRGPVYVNATWTRADTLGHIVNATVNFDSAGGLRLISAPPLPDSSSWFWVRTSDTVWRPANASLQSNGTQLVLTVDTFPFIRFVAVETRAGDVDAGAAVLPLTDAAGEPAAPWSNATITTF